MTDDIDFYRPFLSGREHELVSDAIERRQLSGDGYYTKRAHRLLESLTGADRVLLTTSCTHALEMSALLLDLGPGDEVIMPSFTFVSTANAFALRGARPVFVDIRPDTWNLDESLLEQAITPRTRAIVVVHYAGVACEMNDILAIADEHGLAVIEDAAHGIGATYEGRPLGTLGALGTLSFHATKNVQCGEGGALLINDPALYLRAEMLREKGTDRARFLRGEVDKYTWRQIGSSYLPSELLAAFLTAQLEAFETIQARRHMVFDRYATDLAAWAREHRVHLPPDLGARRHPAHLYALGFADEATRDRFLDHMKEGGIGSTFHYVPLHSAPAGAQYGPSPLPVTDRVSSGLARLPLYPDLGSDEVARVIERVTSFRPV